MNDQEIKKEIEYLIEKRHRYGWTESDAEKYKRLKRELGEDDYINAHRP